MPIRQQVKGNRMVNETLAQYAALMVIKKTFGMDQVRLWLQHSIREYLKGRVNDFDEVPLKDVEDQGYIYYHKGAQAMFTLQEHIGESNLNAAISECIQKNSGYFTNTSHLIKYFRAHAPDSAQQLISDLFENVIIYDNSIKKATYYVIEEDNYQLNMEIEAYKYSMDRHEISFTDWITIEIHTENGIVFKKILISNGKEKYSVSLKDKPSRVLMDPNFNFLDKNPDDHEVKVFEENGYNIK